MDKMQAERIVSIVDCNGNETLLKAMVRNGVFLQSPCGGTGTCGNCKVHLLKPVLPLTEKEKIMLTQEELQNGIRLACCVVTDVPCTVSLPQQEKYEIQTAYHMQAESVMSMSKTALADNAFGIAIDIGTTTIALELINLKNGASVGTVALLNHQSAYGADVMTRISAANAGNLYALQNCIRKDLVEGICNLLAKTNTKAEQIQNMVIAANTTMVHFLMGYPCETLGVAPFTPVNLGPISIKAKDLLGTDVLSCPVWILPGISTYVGGDIVAGLLANGFDQREGPALFIDLGTNGEMALWNKDGIVTASAAAGPAFEGGNLTCGMGSVEGAVCSVTVKNGKIDHLQTIGNKAPCGICGTGVIELLAGLRREGLLDETGLLTEAWFEEGFTIAQSEHGPIRLTQKDIREVQLAKGAILAGIETLLATCGITPQTLGTVYVAGGFGTQLDLEKAMDIGLFPKGFTGKMVAVGNSALGGAVLCLKAPEQQKRAAHICRIAKEISLSGNPRFQDLYIQSMWLKKY